MHSWVAQATDIHFLTGLEAGKAKSKMAAWLGSDEGSLPGSLVLFLEGHSPISLGPHPWDLIDP